MKSSLLLADHIFRLLVIVPLLAFAPSVQGQVSFFSPPTYAGGAPLFVADFSGDGKPDILAGDGTMNLGNGNGTFTTGTRVSGGALAIADFNGDGKPDVLQQGTGTLLVLLGNGDGTFQAPVSRNSGANLTAVAAVDLNGDGAADVVGVFNNFLLVYLSKGDGTFASGVSYNLGAASTSVTTIIGGDFNGDGKTDVAVMIALSTGSGQEIALLGNGDGTLQSPKTFACVSYPFSAVAGDFNGDGKSDLVISTSQLASSPSVTIRLGNGDGTFQSPATIAMVASPAVLGAADLNGDGKLDLVLGEQAFNISNPFLVEVYFGNGDGTFSNTHSYRPTSAGEGESLLEISI